MFAAKDKASFIVFVITSMIPGELLPQKKTNHVQALKTLRLTLRNVPLAIHSKASWLPRVLWQAHIPKTSSGFLLGKKLKNLEKTIIENDPVKL